MAQKYVETRFVLQKRQSRHFPDHDHSKSLHVALQGQNYFVHGQVRITMVY